MTDQTKATLAKLFDEIIANTFAEIEKLQQKIAKKYIVHSAENPKDLFDLHIPVRKNKLPGSKDILTNTRDIAIRVLKNRFDHTLEPTNKDLFQRARLLEKSGLVDRSLVRGYRYGIHKTQKAQKKYPYHAPELMWWFYTQLVQPMRTALLAKNLPVTRLQASPFTPRTETRFYELDKQFKLEPTNLFPFLRKIVVLAHTKSDIEDRLWAFPQIKETHGTQGVFVYMVPRTFTRLSAIREAFANAGMTLLDLTVAQPWEDPDVVTPLVREKKDTNKGIPSLAGVYYDGTIVVPSDPASSTKITDRLENPKYVIKLPRGKDTSSFQDGDFSSAATRAAVRLFGQETGVVISAPQHKAYIEKGSKDLLEHIQEITLAGLKSNKKVRDYLTNDFRRARYMDEALKDFLETIESIPEAAKLFKMPKALGQHETDILIFDQGFMNKSFRYAFEDYKNKRKEIVDKLPYPRENENFYIALAGNKLFDTLKLITTSRLLQTNNPETVSSIVKMLKIILKA